MSYNNNIPLANDFLSVSQPQIRTNFSQLDIISQVNHFELTSANKGKHKIVSMPEEQAGTPVTSPNEMVLFTQNLTTANEPELCIAREDNKGFFPLSRYGVVAAGSFVTTGLLGNVPIRTEFPAFNVADPIVVASTTVYPVVFTNALASTEYVVHVWSKNGTTLSSIDSVQLVATTGFSIQTNPVGRIIYFIVYGGFF